MADETNGGLWAALGAAVAGGAVHLARKFWRKGGHEDDRGSPFVIHSESERRTNTPSRAEVAVVKAHLERLDLAVLGPDGVVAQIHTLRDTCDRLEKTVGEQPSRKEITEAHNKLSANLYNWIESLRMEYARLQKTKE